MIDILYYISLIPVLYHLFKILMKKEKIYSIWIIAIFLNFNYFLYTLQLSEIMQKEKNIAVSLIFFYLNISFFMADHIVLCKTKSKKNTDTIRLRNIYINLGGHKINSILLVNLVYILLFFIENFMGSHGYLFPSFYGIDIHTYSAPIISFVTYNGGILIMINYLLYKNESKYRYLIIALFVFFLPLVTRSARMTTILWLIQFVGFYLIFFTVKIKIKNIVIILLCLYFVGGAFSYFGTDRMNHFGKYDFIYGDEIKYTGFSDPLGVFPWYYGYFVMSIDNMNRTINTIDSYDSPYTYGLFTLTPITVGIFELDNLIPDYPYLEYYRQFLTYSSNNTMVATGFLEFYLDFKYGCIVSILIYTIILKYLFQKTLYNKKYGIIYVLPFSAWMMMVFQNQIISPPIFYGVVFAYFFQKYYFVS